MRTSVGARPHVLVEGGAGAAADDVDGAGGVDHRRVPFSASPRRAGRAARPRRYCGRGAAGLRQGYYWGYLWVLQGYCQRGAVTSKVFTGYRRVLHDTLRYSRTQSGWPRGPAPQYAIVRAVRMRGVVSLTREYPVRTRRTPHEYLVSTSSIAPWYPWGANIPRRAKPHELVRVPSIPTRLRQRDRNLRGTFCAQPGARRAWLGAPHGRTNHTGTAACNPRASTVGKPESPPVGESVGAIVGDAVGGLVGPAAAELPCASVTLPAPLMAIYIYIYI